MLHCCIVDYSQSTKEKQMFKMPEKSQLKVSSFVNMPPYLCCTKIYIAQGQSGITSRQGLS